MRKERLLNALFSETRQGILAATLMHPERWWYLSDLARHLRLRPSSLQRDLARLVEAGILRRRNEGNLVYFKADPTCPIFPELRGMLKKTAGLVDVLRDALQPFGERVATVFVYGSIARAEETPASDIDLMIIGQVGLAELAEPLSKAEQDLGRPINPTVYTREEFAEKTRLRHHFINNVIQREKLFVVGSEDDLAAITDHG